MARKHSTSQCRLVQAAAARVEVLEHRMLLSATLPAVAIADPGDTLDGARLLGSAKQLASTGDSIDVATDVDIYAFTVVGGQRVGFDIDTLTNGSPGLGSYLRLFDGSGRELAANNDAAAPGEPRTGFDAYLAYTFASAGTYYIGVSNWRNTQYDPVSGGNDSEGSLYLTGAYTLTLWSTIDPDDQLAEAHALATLPQTRTLSGAVEVPTDVDMYSFTAMAGQRIGFDIDTATNGSPGLGSYLRLFDASGRQLAANNDAKAPDEPSVGFDSYIEYTFTTGGTYYIGVSNWRNTTYNAVSGAGDYELGQYTSGAYTLTLSIGLSGYVDDGHGHRLPYVRVTLMRGSATVSGPIYTDGDGQFAFPVSYAPANDYRLRVDLSHRPPGAAQDLYKVMHDTADVYALTSQFDASRQSVPMGVSLGSSTLETGSSIPKARLDDLGWSYYLLSQFYSFARSTLSWQPDLALPLKYHAYEPETGDPYARYTGDDQVHVSVSLSGYGNANAPMNREWHETSHYLMDDTIGLPRRDIGDSNHGGFGNHCTSDSWTEGFAEFWPLALKYAEGLKDWAQYAHFGSLEQNYKTWEREEFAVAGLLADLIDPVGENGLDPVQISIQDLWHVFRGSDIPLHDFKDVYDALGIFGIGRTDADKDGLSDLDELFVAHGFFADGDASDSPEYRTWEAGEEVGRAADASRPERRSTPEVRGANILVHAFADGVPVAGAQVVISVQYPSPWQEYTYVDVRDLDQAVGGLVYLHPGPTWLNPSVTVTVRDGAGGHSQTLAFTMDEYRRMANQATQAYAVAEDFDLMPLAELTGGVLTINGTAETDDLHLAIDGTGKLIVTRDGITRTFDAGAATAISILALGGNDTVTMDAGFSIPATIAGGAGNDTITGGAGADLLKGGGGNDLVYGKAGSDTIRGGAGNDHLRGNGGGDNLAGGGGSDTLGGNGGSDTLGGNGGSDTLNGGGLSDVLSGGGGDDWLLGRDGVADTLEGAAGQDRAQIDDGLDQVSGVEELLA